MLYKTNLLSSTEVFSKISPLVLFGKCYGRTLHFTVHVHLNSMSFLSTSLCLALLHYLYQEKNIFTICNHPSYQKCILLT